VHVLRHQGRRTLPAIPGQSILVGSATISFAPSRYKVGVASEVDSLLEISSGDRRGFALARKKDWLICKEEPSSI
jgi:hypothetical protein